MFAHNENLDTVIVIDGVGAVCVNHEKQILAEEVIKHFRPRWQKEAATAVSNGKTPDPVHMVGTMFKKVSIEYEEVHNVIFASMDVLNGVDLQPQSEPAAAPEPAPIAPQEPVGDPIAETIEEEPEDEGLIPDEPIEGFR